MPAKNAAHHDGDRSGLVAEALTVRFPGAPAPALDDATFVVPQGRALAILGPSGCGKSTALRVVAGLQPAQGRVTYAEQDVTTMPAHRRGFSLMFQDGQLFGHLDVFENIAYGLRRRRVPRGEIGPRVEELLHLVGLEGYGDRVPATLSGGQQQRVALARALAPRPRLLLLDEPLSALDRTLRERLAGDLRDVIRAEGVTTLFVTHDHDEALTVADDMALMRAGRVVQTGPARQVWRAPADAEAARFLGYPTVLDAVDAAQLGLERHAWALRRTAWRLARPGEVGLRGVVRHVAAAGDLVSMSVDLEALSGRVVEAALPSGPAEDALAAGQTVQLVVDPARGARLT